MKIDKQFILRKIAGDYVIIPTGRTTLDFNGLITVNEQGAFLWERLRQDVTEGELVDAILAEYEVDEATAAADVEEFLTILRQCGMLSE